MSAFNVTYLNIINQRRVMVVILGYSARTVELEFNTFGGNLSIVAVEQK